MGAGARLQIDCVTQEKYEEVFIAESSGAVVCENPLGSQNWSFPDDRDEQSISEDLGLNTLCDALLDLSTFTAAGRCNSLLKALRASKDHISNFAPRIETIESVRQY